MSALHMRWAVWLRGDQLPGYLLTRRRQKLYFYFIFKTLRVMAAIFNSFRFLMGEQIKFNKNRRDMMESSNI